MRTDYSGVTSLGDCVRRKQELEVWLRSRELLYVLLAGTLIVNCPFIKGQFWE